MPGYFQRLAVTDNPPFPMTPPTGCVPRIKYSSNYNSLQNAFADLQIGDTLFINADYNLTSTAILTQNDVQIIGLGGRITPSSNGNPSPLIQIVNTSALPSVRNVFINGLRFDNNTVGNGDGTGIAIEVRDNIASGSVWHIKLENLSIS